jgi:transposase
LIFKTAIDDPTRIAKSRDVGPLFGLTPGRYQSGETDIIGRITKVGDVMVRTALFEAATVMLTRPTEKSRLKSWALDVAKRRGNKRAIDRPRAQARRGATDGSYPRRSWLLCSRSALMIPPAPPTEAVHR